MVYFTVGILLDEDGCQVQGAVVIAAEQRRHHENFLTTLAMLKNTWILTRNIILENLIENYIKRTGGLVSLCSMLQCIKGVIMVSNG